MNQIISVSGSLTHQIPTPPPAGASGLEKIERDAWNMRDIAREAIAKLDFYRGPASWTEGLDELAELVTIPEYLELCPQLEFALEPANLLDIANQLDRLIGGTVPDCSDVKVFGAELAEDVAAIEPRRLALDHARRQIRRNKRPKFKPRWDGAELLEEIEKAEKDVVQPLSQVLHLTGKLECERNQLRAKIIKHAIHRFERNDIFPPAEYWADIRKHYDAGAATRPAFYYTDLIRYCRHHLESQPEGSVRALLGDEIVNTALKHIEAEQIAEASRVATLELERARLHAKNTRWRLPRLLQKYDADYFAHNVEYADAELARWNVTLPQQQAIRTKVIQAWDEVRNNPGSHKGPLFFTEAELEKLASGPKHEE